MRFMSTNGSNWIDDRDLLKTETQVIVAVMNPSTRDCDFEATEVLDELGTSLEDAIAMAEDNRQLIK